MASGHNLFSVAEKPTQLDCMFEIYMVEIPLTMFGGKSPTPCYPATLPPTNKMTKKKKAQAKPYICKFYIGPKTKETTH